MTQIDPTYHVIAQMAANIQFSLSKGEKKLKKKYRMSTMILKDLEK